VLEAGVFAQGIRPPTVAPGTSRLRLAAMASHTPSELRSAARVVGEAARSLGLDPAEMGPPLVDEPQEDGEIPVAGLSMPQGGGALARATAAAPFDGELGAEGEEPPSAAPSEGPEAPFDFERDLATARAA